VSLGGYYAARAAAYEKRLRAVVALAGPYRFDQDWDELPPQTRATFQARSGAKSEEDARARAAGLTLEAAAAHIDTPLLIVGGGRDAIVPARHQERLAREVKTAELVIYPDGSHGVTNRAYESRSRMADLAVRPAEPLNSTSGGSRTGACSTHTASSRVAAGGQDGCGNRSDDQRRPRCLRMRSPTSRHRSPAMTRRTTRRS